MPRCHPNACCHCQHVSCERETELIHCRKESRNGAHVFESCVATNSTVPAKTAPREGDCPVHGDLIHPIVDADGELRFIDLCMPTKVGFQAFSTLLGFAVDTKWHHSGRRIISVTRCWVDTDLMTENATALRYLIVRNPYKRLLSALLHVGQVARPRSTKPPDPAIETQSAAPFCAGLERDTSAQPIRSVRPYTRKLCRLCEAADSLPSTSISVRPPSRWQQPRQSLCCGSFGADHRFTARMPKNHGFY
mgnify:CR=1 FL=1|jgi:hypothetical protein